MTTSTAPLRVFVVGRVAEDALEGSYARAFRKLGADVTSWDMPGALNRQARLGSLGRYVGNFVTVEAWIMKANRELLLDVLDARPDLVMVFGSTRVMAGTVAQIKAALPACNTVLVWPDSLLYCYSSSISALPVYDLVATYSRATVDSLRRLGGRRVNWVPLGFDPELHPSHAEHEPGDEKYADCDVSFVGNYTPDREQLVLRLISEGFNIKVWGPMEWKRSCRDRTALDKYWQGRPLFGKDFYRAVASAPVSLNPINPVTYPAANMRFFEIPGCGGLSVSARSPEMEPGFPDRQACYYYDSADTIGKTIREALNSAPDRKRISEAARRLVHEAHTYTHRASQILTLLGLTGEVPLQP